MKRKKKVFIQRAIIREIILDFDVKYRYKSVTTFTHPTNTHAQQECCILSVTKTWPAIRKTSNCCCFFMRTISSELLFVCILQCVAWLFFFSWHFFSMEEYKFYILSPWFSFIYVKHRICFKTENLEKKCRYYLFSVWNQKVLNETCI